MANEWHYSIKGKQVGPVSANDLRKLVADGSLGQNDLIWKEGMAEWRKAGTVNGLFPTAPSPIQSQTTGPPPIPALPPPTVGEQARTGVTTLRESAKLTAQIAAKQAEATKIQQVSLPNAFARLGRLVYDNSLSTTGEIKHPEPPDQAPDASFTDKAKALGGKAVTAAKIKAAELQLRKHMIQLGKQTFEAKDHSEAFAEETSAIEQLQTRASEIQAEMADLKRQMSHQGEEMHRLAGSAAKGGYSLLYSTIVVGVSAIFCAPIGLILIWRHPTWGKSAKISWAGVSIASFLLLGTLGQMQQTATRESLAKADALWNSGAQADAMDSYRTLIDDLTFLNSGDQSRILRRVIEYDCEQDNPEEARQLIEKARRYGIVLTLTNSTAKGILAEIDAQEEEESARAESTTEDADEEVDESLAVSTMAKLVVAVIAKSNSWRRTPPNSFNQLMREAASQLGFDKNPSLKHLVSITPSFETSVPNAGRQAKLVKYGEGVSCGFFVNDANEWTLLSVTIDDEVHSALGVSK